MSDIPISSPLHPESPQNRKRRCEACEQRGAKRKATSNFFSKSTHDAGDGSFKTVRFYKDAPVSDVDWYRVNPAERERLAYFAEVIVE